MKLKSFVLGSIILLLQFSNLLAQSPADTSSIEIEEKILIGEFSRSEIQIDDFGNHFMEEYRAYKPCDDAIRSLETNVYQYTILIVMATWCHDSQIQVPRFYKILDQLDYETAYVKNICLDKNKEVAGIDIADLNIERVPTFIFLKGDKEIGRIVETPEISLEKDTYRILSQ